MDYSLVAQVGFVSLMPDISDQVCPTDAVGGLYEPWVGDWAEGFADVGGVGDVAVGAEEDGS